MQLNNLTKPVLVTIECVPAVIFPENTVPQIPAEAIRLYLFRLPRHFNPLEEPGRKCLLAVDKTPRAYRTKKGIPTADRFTILFADEPVSDYRLLCEDDIEFGMYLDDEISAEQIAYLLEVSS